MPAMIHLIKKFLFWVKQFKGKKIILGLKYFKEVRINNGVLQVITLPSKSSDLIFIGNYEIYNSKYLLNIFNFSFSYYGKRTSSFNYCEWLNFCCSYGNLKKYKIKKNKVVIWLLSDHEMKKIRDNISVGFNNGKNYNSCLSIGNNIDFQYKLQNKE